MRLSRGRSRSTPRRLCSRAPRTTRRGASESGRARGAAGTVVGRSGRPHGGEPPGSGWRVPRPRPASRARDRCRPDGVPAPLLPCSRSRPPTTFRPGVDPARAGRATSRADARWHAGGIVARTAWPLASHACSGGALPPRHRPRRIAGRRLQLAGVGGAAYLVSTILEALHRPLASPLRAASLAPLARPPPAAAPVSPRGSRHDVAELRTLCRRGRPRHLQRTHRPGRRRHPPRPRRHSRSPRSRSARWTTTPTCWSAPRPARRCWSTRRTSRSGSPSWSATADGARLRTTVTTHRHYDHWQALGAVAERFATRQVAHPLDAPGAAGPGRRDGRARRHVDGRPGRRWR